MRRRLLAYFPLAIAGFAVAAGCAMDASAQDAPKRKTAAPAIPKKTRGDSHGRAHRASATRLANEKQVSTARTWGDFSVIEGSLPEPALGAVCPPEMANVDDRFCIDRWEDSLVEVLSDGRDVPWPAFSALEEGHALRAVSVSNVYPQAYVSGAEAARACASAGKRLCAPVEWRKACTGSRAQAFGYGSERIAGRCNEQGRSPMLALYPQVTVSWTLVGMTELNDPRLNQLEGTLAPTGSYEGCTNDYGVFDMVGNLHEWTNDANGTFQGGYYLDTHKNGDGCAYRTVAHEFTYHDYSTGFRCCAEPAVP